MVSSLKYLFFGLVLIGLSLSQNECDRHNNCADCDFTPGCGWCSATQKCVKGNADGPSDGYMCKGVAWEWGKCPNCTAQSSCRSCLAYNTDCYWCVGTKKCIDYSDTNAQFCPVKRIDSCDCATYPTCTECLERTKDSCAWCSTTKSCLPSNATDTCPMLAHSCPCGDNKDCQSCITDDGCGWCSTSATCSSIALNPSCPLAHTCTLPLCQDQLECSSCNKVPGCKWCSNLGTCKPASFKPNECAESGCNDYCAAASRENCDVCNALKGCGWCKIGSKYHCVDIESTPTCLAAHSCPSNSGSGGSKKKSGFDGGSFVGGMFLVVGLALLGGIGFLVYRHYFSERRYYNEMNQR